MTVRVRNAYIYVSIVHEQRLHSEVGNVICRVAKTSQSLHGLSVEHLHISWISLLAQSVGGVIGVVWLKFKVVSLVKVVFFLGHMRSDFHEHVKGLICLVLAVLDAQLLTWCLSLEHLRVHAVQVALSEEQSW